MSLLASAKFWSNSSSMCTLISSVSPPVAFSVCNLLFLSFACQNTGLLFHPLLPLFPSVCIPTPLPVAVSKRIPLTLLSGVTIRHLMK